MQGGYLVKFTKWCVWILFFLFLFTSFIVGYILISTGFNFNNSNLYGALAGLGGIGAAWGAFHAVNEAAKTNKNEIESRKIDEFLSHLHDLNEKRKLINTSKKVNNTDCSFSQDFEYYKKILNEVISSADKFKISANKYIHFKILNDTTINCLKKINDINSMEIDMSDQYHSNEPEDLSDIIDPENLPEPEEFSDEKIRIEELNLYYLQSAVRNIDKYIFELYDTIFSFKSSDLKRILDNDISYEAFSNLIVDYGLEIFEKLGKASLNKEKFINFLNRIFEYNNFNNRIVYIGLPQNFRELLFLLKDNIMLCFLTSTPKENLKRLLDRINKFDLKKFKKDSNNKKYENYIKQTQEIIKEFLNLETLEIIPN